MVETTSRDSTVYRALYIIAISRGRSTQQFRLPQLRRRLEDHRRYPPVIIKILSHLGRAYRPAPRPCASSSSRSLSNDLRSQANASHKVPLAHLPTLYLFSVIFVSSVVSL